MADEVNETEIEEGGVVLEIAGEKTAGFLIESENPGEAEFLHPHGSVTLCAGVDVEGEADAKQDAAGKVGLVVVNPLLLLGCAQPDPYDVGGKTIDLGDNGGAVRRLGIAGVGTDNPKATVAQGLRVFEQLLRSERGATEKIVLQLSVVHHGIAKEGGAVDAIAQAGTHDSQAPEKRHTVGNEVIVGGGGRLEGGIRPAHGDDLSVAELGSDGTGSGGPVGKRV